MRASRSWRSRCAARRSNASWRNSASTAPAPHKSRRTVRGSRKTSVTKRPSRPNGASAPHAYGIPVGRIAELALGQKSIAPEMSGNELHEAVRHATAHATERDAAPDRRELETFALQHAMGRTVLERVRPQSTAIGMTAGLSI